MVRIVPFIVVFGLLVAYAGGYFESATTLQMVYFGAAVDVEVQSPASLDFDDCAMVIVNGMPTMGDDCDLEAWDPTDPERYKYCNHSIAFLPGDRPVRRLRAEFAIMKDGRELSRTRLRLDEFEPPVDGKPAQTNATVRGECDADGLRLVEAHALVDGQDTDLIATQSIRARSLIPLLPWAPTFVTVATPAGAS